MKLFSLASFLTLLVFVVAQTITTTTDEPGTGSLPPSPTESVGCEPHGDHWHCDAPASQTGVAAATTGTESHDHEDEDHDETGTGVLPPSPIESTGCEPHGDHWHCEGPASTAANRTITSAPATVTSAVSSATSAVAETASTAAAQESGNGAGQVHVQLGLVAALLMAAVA